MTKQGSDQSLPRAPTYNELPTAKPRAVRSGPELAELRVRLEVVTPILGGSHQTRAIDNVDVIRGPSVRGHLRFWWRALYASQCLSAEALFQRESALWGRAETDDGGRSAVEIRVDVEGNGGALDDSDINLQQTPGAYALWPARAEKKQGQVVRPPAPRRQPGTQFQLTLKVAATDEAEIRNALRAWILFGGYGGRTRRGLGTLKVLDNANEWLPAAVRREAFTSLFEFDIFAATTKTPGDVPWLEGAAIHVGQVDRNAEKAWTTALDWLKVFRQGTTGNQGERAREPSSDPKRPSISNWPEADKIRRVKNKINAHAPRHNATVAWPRAGFGLPIIGQFQTTDRQGNAHDEPGKFEIRWRSPKTDRPGEFDEHDRLASSLIVKALPIVDDKGTIAFVPCALWLNRSYPNSGQVGLARPKQGRPNEKEVDPATAASFNSSLVANGDTARFSALVNKASLRQAFLDWLRDQKKTTVVAP
jgi:CRISPR-associated protein Cmr1